MKTLFIVTPLSRPENFSAIQESVGISAWKGTPDPFFFVRWVVIVDKAIATPELIKELQTKTRFYATIILVSPHEKALAGHAHRNFFLDYYRDNLSGGAIGNEWAYFLDDDTLLQGDFIGSVFNEMHDERFALVFDQNNPDGSLRLIASKVAVGFIDMGMYMIHLGNLPEDLRFVETDYCADGIFIERLHKMYNGTGFHHIGKVLSVYNQLRP